MKKNNALSFIIEKTKGTRLKMFFLLFFCVVTSFISVSLAILIRGIVNSAIAGNYDKLVQYSIITVSTVIIYFVIVLINNYLKESIRYKIEIKLKQDLFDAVLKKEYSSITAYHSGDILNRLFSDNVIVAEHATQLLPSIVSMASRLLFAFIALISLALEFTLILFCCGVFIVLFSFAFRKVMKKMHKETQEAVGKVRSYMQEATENILAVKVFSNEKKVLEKSENLQSDYYKKRIRQRKFFIIANSGLGFFFMFAYILAAVYGAFAIYNNPTSFDYGTLTALLQLVSQVQSPLSSISGIVPHYYGMIASAERLLDIYNLADELDGEEIDVNDFYNKMQGIEVKNLSFSYGRELILDDTDCFIKKGDFICIKGISGIGKSTLFKLILGVYSNFNGEINFVCDDKTYQTNKSLRKLFSYVPQGNMLFSGTLKENICFIKEDATEEEIEKALKLSCAYDFVKDLPNGLDTVIGEKGVGLSEGQIQRIAIARALIVNAPILLLDEATSALDEQTEEMLLNNLKELKDVTLLTITHKKASEQICDKTIVIENKKFKVV